MCVSRMRSAPIVDRQHVGQVSRACVDVAAHRVDRRDLRELLEHREIADVAAVKDRVGRELGQALRGLRVRLRMRIGDRCEPYRATGPIGNVTDW